MLQDVLFVRGALSPARLEKITDDTTMSIRQALNEEGLWWIPTQSFDWQKVVVIQSGVTITLDDDEESKESSLEPEYRARKFAESIQRFVQAEGVSDLELEGNLLITVDEGPETHLFRAMFKKAELTFQKSVPTWGI